MSNYDGGRQRLTHVLSHIEAAVDSRSERRWAMFLRRYGEHPKQALADKIQAVIAAYGECGADRHSVGRDAPSAGDVRPRDVTGLADERGTP